MSTISASAVSELRKKTDLPLMDCKKALTEAGGDMDKAVELLRSWNAKATIKREGNETAEGRIGIAIYVEEKVAAIVEMRCESAPSAKSDQFIALAGDVARHLTATTAVAADVPSLLTQPFGKMTVKDRIDEVVGLIREKMVVHKFTRLSGGVFGQYVHHDGSVGVLLQCNGDKQADEPLRDICAHIAALNPPYLTVADVPADVLEKEKAIAASQIKEDPKNASKPANIIEKIADGKIKTWLAEGVLMEQPMANGMKYPNKTVGEVLKGLGLTPVKFVRYKVGAVTV